MTTNLYVIANAVKQSLYLITKTNRRIVFRVFLSSSLLLLLLFLTSRRQDFLRPVAANSAPAKFDHPDLAMHYEFERTKDPALGYVPKERLYQAYQYSQTLRKIGGGNQTLGAISGITWTERGPNNVGGRTRAIMVDPNDVTKKTIWAGGVDGGLWKTTNITVASPVWVQVNDFFSNMAVTTIAYNSTTPSIMYFGTGEGWGNLDAVRGDGIWKSTDGGATWSQLVATASNSNFDFVSKIVVSAAGDVYAATRSRFCNRGGIFKSTDLGATWTLVLGTQDCCSCALSFCSGDDIEIAADGSFYAAMGDSNQPDGVYRSTTGNAGTWTKLNTGANGFPTAGIGRIEIACAPSAAGIAYAMVHNPSTDALLNIYKTTNSGATWTTATLPVWHDQGACGSTSTDMTRNQAWYDLILAIDPANANIVFAGGVDVMKTTNGGTSWTQLSNWAGSCFPLIHADQHAIVFESGSSSVIYFGNDGGVYRSADGGATITSKNTSYNVTQFYSCAIHPTTTDYFLTGAQDNGSHQFTAAGMNSTTEVTGGDGAFCHIDQDQAAFQFTQYVFQRFFRSTNSGATWSGTIDFGAFGKFINPTDYDNIQNKIYGADDPNFYFRWDDPQTGATSAFVGPFATEFGGGQVSAVTVSPNTTNRVFFGIDNGRIVRVDNAHLAGPTVTNITGAGMPSGTVTVSSIAVETGNDNHILATYSNYGVNSVWETTNGGTTWTSIEGNLPDMPIRWIIFSPSSNTQAMVATELGVWSTDLLSGASTNWGTSNTGLANVRVDMLKVRSSDKLVVAATHGRGLFTTTIPALPIGLLNFDAEQINDAVKLTWTTATEINNDYFEIQRNDGMLEGWNSVGKIQGAGNSSSTLSYEFIDALSHLTSQYSTLYYRLKQIDFDGKFSYSSITAVNLVSAKNLRAIHVYPNPANAVLSYTVSSTDENVPLAVTVTDVSGKIVFSEKEIFTRGITAKTIDVSGFSNGAHILQIANPTRNKKAESKFIVQH